MSNKVDQFLSESGGNNFTVTASRPPALGEENEKESNGGMSTQSSGSHKSQVSHTSGKSITSNKGDVNPATPRKSNIDKTPQNLWYTEKKYADDIDAPLGFEPEGSAANSPPFTESSTPPYLKWAESLHCLLDDREGVQLFRTFLDQEGIGTYSLDFWFACQGLKLKEKNRTEASQIIKIIHKKYIKSDKLPYMDLSVKQEINNNIRQLQTDPDSHSESPVLMNVDIFNKAQLHVERYMKSDTYPLFLKSDLYVQYVSKETESPKSSNSSSGSNSVRPLSSGPLPTLREDQELQQDDFVAPYNMYGPPLSNPKSNRYVNCDIKRLTDVYSASYTSYSQRSIPYHHVSYAPVSAQDSEIQSLSSQDALTDDTRSLTDSSVDGHSYIESRRHRRSQHSRIQRQASQNREMGHNFIPRTERAPKDRNIAEVDCRKFADQLIQRLLKVQKDREKDERAHVNLTKVMNQSDIIEPLEKSSITQVSSRNTTTSSSLALLTSSMMEQGNVDSQYKEENADSILEEHLSRIWAGSAQQTPSRSPGWHSPRSKSPDRLRKSLSQNQQQSSNSSMLETLHTKPLHKKRIEFYSMPSFDCATREDINSKVETHKHIHHHHHHHHERRRKSKHKLEFQAQQHSIMCCTDGTPRPHNGTRLKPANSRNHTDVCSNLDSGIGMIEPIGQPHPNVIISVPSTTKVLQWILDNDNIKGGTSTALTDSDKTSSTCKFSKKSSALALVPTQPNKHSGSKKGNGGHIIRSSSADSNNHASWIPHGTTMGEMPSQPIVQDSSMPIMPPPNTRVQLEEVGRRLHEADAWSMNPVKSKSFPVVSNKDHRTGTLPSQVVGQEYAFGVLPPKTVPSDLDTAATENRNEKRSKRSSGSGNTSGSSKLEETSIGYYMCGDPIPYKITIPHATVTLGLLKQHIGKRGNYRYFAKTHDRHFDSNAVYEEISDDNRVLPEFDGKIIVKVEKRDDLDTSNKSGGSDKKL